MKFLIDESADARMAMHLSALGHDATTVAGDHRPGLSDPEVLSLARRERRLLITDDSDFGELVVRHAHLHAGVLLFRLNTTLLAVRIERLDFVLSHHAGQLTQLVVIGRHRIRIVQTAR